jgi:hypothetical protein
MTLLSNKEIEDAKELLKDNLFKQLELFCDELSAKYKEPTVRSYETASWSWIEYVYDYTMVIEFNELKVSQCRSSFYNQVQYEIDTPSNKVYQRLKTFFVFLKEEGYSNPKVFKAYGI